jgi:hypothetical protein
LDHRGLVYKTYIPRQKGLRCAFSATQSVARRRYLTDMLTLETLKTEVDDLRETVRMADSDSVETRQLLKAQTSTLNALRADQIGLRGLMDQQAKILGEQSIGIGNLVIAARGPCPAVRRPWPEGRCHLAER